MFNFPRSPGKLVFDTKPRMEDKFTYYKRRVEKAVKQYDDFVSKHKEYFKDSGLSESIHSNAQPFLNGHFTLAVMGNTSAGKSTFINALLGQVNLLPTDQRQTTCVMTEIVYGDELSIEITYGDGHVEVVSDPHVLRDKVAIPEDFRDFPVTMVNDWILDGLNPRQLVRPLMLEKIKEILVAQGKESISEHLTEKDSVYAEIKKMLEDYSDRFDKSSIPTSVIIRYPLADSYRGWKILDTPGVNALGGIQDKTTKLINHKDENNSNSVDAILFLKSGLTNISEKSFYDFVVNTFKRLTPETQKRVFVLITHASSPQFVGDKGFMESAYDLFSNFDIERDRIMPVDSLCELLHKYCKENNQDLLELKKKNCPLPWDQNTWELCVKIKNQIKSDIEEEEELEVNNQSIDDALVSMAGFQRLHERLNEFVEITKSEVYKSIIDDIKADYKSVATQIKKNIDFERTQMTGDETKIKAKMDESDAQIKMLQSELEAKLQIISNDYSMEYLNKRYEKYDYAFKVLRNGNNTIDNMKATAVTIQNEFRDESISIMQELAKRLKMDVNQATNGVGVSLPNIDFRAITTSATKAATKVIEIPHHVSGGCCSSAYDWTEKKTEVDKDKVLKGFAERLFQTYKTDSSNFKQDFIRQIGQVGDKAKAKIQQSVENEKQRFAEIQKEYTTVEAQRKHIESLTVQLQAVETLDKELDY